MTNDGSDYVSISNRLLELEDERGFFDVVVDGIPVWERTRYTVQQHLLSATGVIDQGGRNSGPTASKGRYLRALRTLLRGAGRRNPFFTTGHDFLAWGHPRRKLLEDGYWWDIYFDPIYEAAALDYLHIENEHGGTHATPARTEHLRYLDPVRTLAQLLRKLGLDRPELSHRDRVELDEVNAAIEETFGVAVGFQEMVLGHLELRRPLRRLYGMLIERVDPDVVLLVVSNGRETFIEACQNAGVPVVELQHGTPTKYQFGYSYPGGRTKETFPDYLLTHGEYWANSVQYPISDENVIPVGYPYLENRAQRFSKTQAIDQILFISQPTIGTRLAEFAVDVAPVTDHDVVYKLHPHEYPYWRESYPSLIDAPITVIDDDSIPLYRLFAESSAQVGVYSTALYEGLYFGLQTFVLDAPGAQQVSELLARGYATEVTSPDEVEARLGDSWELQFDTDDLFEPNAVDNVIDAIQRIRSETGA